MKGKRYLIREFTEFNLQRMNDDSVQPAIAVNDPSLSLDAFDKHQDLIRQAMSKLNGILSTLSNSSGFRSLKHHLNNENQKIQKMVIKRIIKNNINFDVYITFYIEDYEYWGVIYSILDRNPEVKSEVFKDYDLVQSKDWIIRTKGLLTKSIKNWLVVEPGNYLLENDYVNCYDIENGYLVRLTKGSEVRLIRCYDNKATIEYDNKYYNLINENFVYFNYWFRRL